MFQFSVIVSIQIACKLNIEWKLTIIRSFPEEIQSIHYQLFIGNLFACTYNQSQWFFYWDELRCLSFPLFMFPPRLIIYKFVSTLLLTFQHSKRYYDYRYLRNFNLLQIFTHKTWANPEPYQAPTRGTRVVLSLMCKNTASAPPLKTWD